MKHMESCSFLFGEFVGQKEAEQVAKMVRFRATSAKKMFVFCCPAWAGLVQQS